MTSLWRPYSVPGTPSTLRLTRGTGAYVSDEGGREYLNASGGLWNLTLGLGHEQVVQRIEAQLRDLAYGPLFEATHSPAELLASRLVAASDGRMESAYLSTSGTAAMEVAMRVARLHHRAAGRPDKRRILAFDRSYHGCSAFTLSASGIVARDLAGWEEILPDFQLVPSPADEPRSLEALRHLLATEGDSIACLVLEPVLGSGGIIVPSRSYCEELNRLCRLHDVLLVADEVATGGGRCGAMFASQLLGLEPDIVALSKGLAAGYLPIGATLFARRVCEPLQKRGVPLQFGSTQDGNPVACAAALAALDIFAGENLFERASELGQQIRSRLALLVESGAVRQIRGLGLMIGLELPGRLSPLQACTEAEAAQVRSRCQEEGLLVYHFDGGISLFPPLTITDDEIEDMLGMLQSVFEASYA
jgi:adenosylmethionine-8-amino-7-oxononanoate aminotransferase